MNEGRILTHPALARQRFTELASRPDAAIDLTETSLVIAQEAFPALDIERYVSKVDEWSAAIRGHVADEGDIEALIEAINRFLFEEEGFRGEADDYYDPRHALLNEVLDRHEGLPISLSILYLVISRRLGLDASGVALPGRFVVKVSSPQGELLVDPFDSGNILTRGECQKLLDELYGGGVMLREQHLRSCSNLGTLERLLSHLKAAYLVQEDLHGALAAIERLLILDEFDPYGHRERATLEMQLHAYDDAIRSFERYLGLMPTADDAPRVRAQIEYIRGWLTKN